MGEYYLDFRSCDGEGNGKWRRATVNRDSIVVVVVERERVDKVVGVDFVRKSASLNGIEMRLLFLE